MMTFKEEKEMKRLIREAHGMISRMYAEFPYERDHRNQWICDASKYIEKPVRKPRK